MTDLGTRVRHRATTEVRKLTGRRTLHPSFTSKFYEYARIRKLLAAQGVRDPAYLVNAKDDAHRWAARLGIRTPELIGIYDDIDQVPWSSLPDRVVVKPTRGTASTAVFVLQRSGEGWEDLHRHRLVTVEQLTRDSHALSEPGAISRAVLVERMVEDPRRPGQPPIDYKVHAFYGTIGVIEGKWSKLDAQGEPVGYFHSFDPQWRVMGGGNVMHADRADPAIPPPIHGDELLEMARIVSASLPRPYLRVDLYDDAQGPVFGEITPEMGAYPRPPRALDQHLGRLWEEAEARLRIRIVKAGVLDPADGPQEEAFLDLST